MPLKGEPNDSGTALCPTSDSSSSGYGIRNSEDRKHMNNVCKYCGEPAIWWFISGLIKTCNKCKGKVFA